VIKIQLHHIRWKIIFRVTRETTEHYKSLVVILLPNYKLVGIFVILTMYYLPSKTLYSIENDFCGLV
jgi:hypothetical protein